MLAGHLVVQSKPTTCSDFGKLVAHNEKYVEYQSRKLNASWALTAEWTEEAPNLLEARFFHFPLKNGGQREQGAQWRKYGMSTWSGSYWTMQRPIKIISPLLGDSLTASKVELQRVDEEFEELELEYAGAVEYFVRALHELAEINPMIGTHQATTLHQVIPAESTATGHAPPATTHSKNGGTRLPRMEIPLFSGEWQDWLKFWQQYNVTINEKWTSSPVENVNHLDGNK